MSKITPEDVTKIATLARLDVPEEQKSALAQQMNGILGYIEMLNELDTDGVEPTSHAIPIGTAWREDVAVKSPAPEKALKNSPERSDEFVVVPKIIE